MSWDALRGFEADKHKLKLLVVQRCDLFHLDIERQIDVLHFVLELYRKLLRVICADYLRVLYLLPRSKDRKSVALICLI